ncbi:hypothetical protein ACOSQ2_033004 [Xanthoceras sorbifolium]|uniref:DUF674 domain-containing protein n=1 Tax=Xanthoceras sorbifolium TaxID=99658 RepID=A0ABQ8H3Y6_9ROSI|nr:hypothetical protein JRO89_XS14G0056600 [Xanthoceras sorbifolium]
MAASTIKLKLLVDTKAKKVILAEAGKDFIDFLIHLLSLPLATVVRLLKEKNMVGSLSYLYETIENLPDSCLQPGHTKKSLLNPRASIRVTGIPLTLSNNDLETRYFYCCANYYSHHTVADVPNMTCPTCMQKMSCTLSYVSSTAGVGFVNGSSVTYIVMENLEFMPMSPELFVTLLKKFKNREVCGALEEIDVNFGMQEGLNLLKLSMECNTVLTNFYQANVVPKV